MSYTTYLHFSMARSGCHTVINWICRNYPGAIIHKNNCIRGWEEGKLIPWNAVRRPYQPRMDRKATIEYQKKHGKGFEAELCNFEWYDMEDFKRFDFPSFEVFKQGRVCCVVHVRDPYNWLASSMQLGVRFLDEPYIDPFGRNHGSAVEIYIRQMEQALGLKDYLEWDDTVILNYNRWFCDKIYRDKVAGQLGIEATDNGTQGVSRFGSGSSFDRYKYDNKTWAMPVNERWKNYYNNKRFRKLVKPLAEMSSEFFHFSPLRMPG